MAKYIDITSIEGISHFTVEHISVVESVCDSSVEIYSIGSYKNYPCKDDDNALQARRDIIDAMNSVKLESTSVTGNLAMVMDCTIEVGITKYQEPST